MDSERTRRSAGWFAVAVGSGVVVWWCLAAFVGIGELEEGRVDIVFHLAAEFVMAALLLACGALVLLRPRSAIIDTITGVALGTLLYSCINSPGYFAEREDWWAVAMFAVVAAGAIGSIIGLARADSADPSPNSPAVSAGTRYGREP